MRAVYLLRLSKQFALSILLFTTSGCMTGPKGRDYAEYNEDPLYQDNFYGELRVINQTGDSMKEVRWDEDQDQILRDLKKSKKSFIKDNQGRNFTLTYLPCNRDLKVQI